MLNQLDPTVTLQIPVGPATQALGLTLRDADIEFGRGEIPVFAQMSLVSPSGANLEQVGPTWNSGSTPPQDLTVLLHNAPAGGRLVVQIAASRPNSETGPGTTSTASTQSASSAVLFIMDVTRQDAPVTSQDAGMAVQGASAGVGSANLAPLQQGRFLFANSPSPTAPSTPAEQDTGLLQNDAPVTAALVSAATEPNLAIESADSFDMRVATGPLASRSAGPLGPMLAAVDSDPTQPVDRHERALWQEIDGLGAGVETTAWQADSNVSEPAMFPLGQDVTSGVTGTVGPVVAVAGRGGFPSKVTSQGRVRPIDFEALWATLPASSSSERQVAPPTHPGVGLPEIALEHDSAHRNPSDPLEFPDYVKAACGLALGLGLTSGPLFPDLIASRPRKFAKWLVALKALGARPARRRFSLPKARAWFNRIVASR
jgi:hypothetical protein